MTRGGSPASGLGVGLTTPHHKNKPVTKVNKKPRTWTDSLDKQPYKITCKISFDGKLNGAHAIRHSHVHVLRFA
jgi:hypothetical protein